jgi:hypothetical protein
MDVDSVSPDTTENAVIVPNTASDDFVPVQLLSDLHLEVPFKARADFGQPGPVQGYTIYDFPVRAPNLALLGDIGLVRDADSGFLNWLFAQLKRFERVFFVLGNHEFYGMSHVSLVL